MHRKAPAVHGGILRAIIGVDIFFRTCEIIILNRFVKMEGSYVDFKEKETGLLSAKIGFWSALSLLVLTIGYTVGAGVGFAVMPVEYMMDIRNFAAKISGVYQNFFSLCQATAFLIGPVYLVLLCCISEYTPNEKKILSRIAISFGIIFTVLSCFTYYVQFTTVRQSILIGQLEGLDQFTVLNPRSAIGAINLLGWTLFLGLSSLFIAPTFDKVKLEKVIKWTLNVSGIACVLGAIAFVLEISWYLMLYTMITTITFTVASISLCIFFKRMGKK